MRLLTFFLASLYDDSVEADMVSHKLLGMPAIVSVSPLSLAAGAGGVEVTDRASGERSMRPMEDVELVRQGVVVVNGPFDEQSDPSYRGMSIFACDAAEAARLSDGDPSVVAGRLADVMEWWVRVGSLAFPLTDRQVGDRRSMPDKTDAPRSNWAKGRERSSA
jgi:hypothetical protein